MKISLSHASRAVIERFAEEIKQYPTEQIEALVRELARRDMRETRRKYPELFKRE